MEYETKGEYMRKIEEAVDAKKIIKDLADTDFSGSNAEQGKMAALVKGLAFSDEPESNKFMKALDKFTTDYGKNLESKKESLTIKGKGQTIDLNENQTLELEEGKIYSLIEMQDFRDVFQDLTVAKESFENLSMSRKPKLSSRQLDALDNIFDDGMGFLELEFEDEAFKTGLFPPTPQIEWIVSHPAFGYFYVNTEGFNYARYAFAIEDVYAEKMGWD